MKKIIALILGVFLLIGLSSCGTKNPIKYEKIDYDIEEKGVLKTTILTSYTSDFPSNRKDTFINDDGLVLFEYYYDYNKKNKKWELNNKTFNSYDENNLLVKKEEYSKWYNNPIITTYDYDSFGLIAFEIETKDGEETITTYEYDSNNNLVCEITDGPRDYNKCEYVYDENNNLITEHFYSSGNGGATFFSETKYEYTYENNRLLKKEFEYLYNKNWKKDNLEEYTYDELNNVKEILYYNVSKDGKEYKEDRKEKYSYDKKNNIVKVVEYDRGNKYWSLQKWNESFKTKYEYDGKNNLISKYEYSVSIWETKAYAKTNYYYTYFD